jgi:hypothetical protein
MNLGGFRGRGSGSPFSGLNPPPPPSTAGTVQLLKGGRNQNTHNVEPTKKKINITGFCVPSKYFPRDFRRISIFLNYTSFPGHEDIFLICHVFPAIMVSWLTVAYLAPVRCT